MNSNIKSLVNVEHSGALQGDLNSPYSFLQWKSRTPNIVETDAKYFYNQYIIKWFEKKTENQKVTPTLLLRQRYKFLLDQLQLFFTSEEKNKWYNFINLSDEKELLLSIPYFAKKLKKIALYYLSVRNSIKNSKIKYNLVGTKFGVEKSISNLIYENFVSSTEVELPPAIIPNLPQKEEIVNTLQVEVQELYDDHQYFDRSYTMPTSAYFNVLDEATANFFATKGLVLSSDEWVFNTFNIPVTSSVDSFIDSLTGTVFEVTDNELYFSFLQKFISEPKYIINVDPKNTIDTTTLSFDVKLTQGNNFFYYPYGTTDFSTKQPKQMDVVSLSTVDVQQGTAGSSLEDSDTMFVKVGSTTKAAWLRYVEFEDYKKTLKADLKKDRTTFFIYPYPGYGLAAEDVPWTGPDFVSTTEYNFLTKNIKSIVNDAYWGQTLPSDDCTKLLINNSTLATEGATPHENPFYADHVYVRKTRELDITIPHGEVEGAWLYKFTKTSIPVSPSMVNRILWPYQTYELENIPDFFNTLSLSSVCKQTTLNQMVKTGCIAGNSIETADKIYRLNNIGDSKDKAIEVAWLSGSTVIATEEFLDPTTTQILTVSTAYVEQNSFNALFPPGKAIKFIWNGDEISPNKVFKYVPHRKDCRFFTNMPALSSRLDWQKCSCKAVYHTPFGHNADTFETGNLFADVLIEITKEEIEEFDFSTWKDVYGRTKTSSKNFSWYRTKKNTGWEKGRWVANIANENGAVVNYTPFNLKPGRAYIYRRSDSGNSGDQFPSYTKTYYHGNANTKWIAAKYVPGDGWVSSGIESDMKIHPGSFLEYERSINTTNYLLSTTEKDVFAENRGSVWSNFDYVPLKCYGGQEQVVIVQWPITPIKGSENTTNPQEEDYIDLKKNQYPVESSSDISDITWTITRRANNADGTGIKRPISETYSGSPTLTFVPKYIGIYDIEVSYRVQKLVPAVNITANPIGGGVTVDTIGTNREEIYLNTYPQNGVVISQDRTTNGLWKYQIEAREDWNNPLYKPTELNLVDVPKPLKNIPYKQVQIYNPAVAVSTGSTTNPYAPVTGKKQQIVHTLIPSITVVPPTIDDTLYIPFNCPSNGFLIEQPIRGWSYKKRNFSSGTSGSEGAKPYWATVYVQKDPSTRYKGLYSWGYEEKYIDGYLPDTAPKLSPLAVEFGNVLEYQRKGSSFTWNQPIVYNKFIGKAKWCKIYQNFNSNSNLAEFYKIKNKPEPIAIPLLEPTDIVLSNMIDGAPVEVYYYAINSFNWPISANLPANNALPLLENFVVPSTGNQNISNSFYPTIATVPVLEDVYDSKYYGGYFLPSNLGASRFINKNFTAILDATSLSGSYITEDVNFRIGGRGLTKQDQPSIFTWIENNEWVKEPPIAGNLAGATKKSLTKPLQTFIPYYSDDSNDHIGLYQKQISLSPWGGANDENWIDNSSSTKTFTGKISVSKWKENQIVNENVDKTTDCLCSDVFGNQYGLLKDSGDSSLLSEEYGDLWVRDASQNIKPGNVSLSAAYAIANFDDNIQFKTIDTFYNVLCVESSNKLAFFGLEYDYENNLIGASTDKYTSITLNETFVFQKNWLDSKRKKIFSLFFKEESNHKSPVIYETTFAERSLTTKKVFELTEEEEAQLENELSDASFKCTEGEGRASFSYNETTNTFLICANGTVDNEVNPGVKPFILDFYIKDDVFLTLTKYNLYI